MSKSDPSDAIIVDEVVRHDEAEAEAYLTSPPPSLSSFASSLHEVPPKIPSGAKVPGRVLSSQSAGYWLVGSAGLVFGIVVFGGLTRLTESGLSITEWKPVTGVVPPVGNEAWEEEFQKYRSSPEFKKLNPNMGLSEFKFIYYMEWTHRIWGRVIGLIFVIPGVYFVARGKVSPRVAARITGIAGLIGLQGLLGWWMVESGLKDDVFQSPGDTPRVSQYRLAAHLGAAFLVYVSMLWTGLEILQENKWHRDPAAAVKSLEALSNPRLPSFKRSVAGLACLIFLTALSGAFVAGLDAGLIYNEFPWMGSRLVPPSNEMWNSFYSRKPDQSDLWWRNMLENPATVQFDHRVLATTTFLATAAVYLWSRRLPLPKTAHRGALGVMHLVLLQVALGISTLIYFVPTPLAASHQAGSLALLTGVLVLGSRLRLPRAAVRNLLEPSRRAKVAITARPRLQSNRVQAAMVQ